MSFFNPLNALPGKSLSPLGVFGHKDPLSKAINGLFGGSPDPYKVNKQTGMYNVNGAKGGNKFLGGTFDPSTGTFTMNNPKGRDFSQQQAAIDAYLAGTGPRPEGKQFSRLLKAIDASGYMSGMNGPGAQQAAAAPWSTSAFAPMMPALMQQTAAFARPEALSFLQAMTGQGQQTAGAAQGMGAQPQPGMMYAGGTPGFYSGGANMGTPMGQQPGMMYTGGSATFREDLPYNPFLAAGMKAPGYMPMPAGPVKSGPAPSPFLGLNRLAGPFGNGGGALVPQIGMNMMGR